eukprot:950650-Pelagomonas_calceolata.AAC.2
MTCSQCFRDVCVCACYTEQGAQNVAPPHCCALLHLWRHHHVPPTLVGATGSVQRTGKPCAAARKVPSKCFGGDTDAHLDALQMQQQQVDHGDVHAPWLCVRSRLSIGATTLAACPLLLISQPKVRELASVCRDAVNDCPFVQRRLRGILRLLFHAVGDDRSPWMSRLQIGNVTGQVLSLYTRGLHEA